MSGAAEFAGAVAQIRTSNGVVVGAGFVVAGGALLTCAHVVHAAGSGPGEAVTVTFRGRTVGAGEPLEDTVVEVVGTVLSDPWRAADERDVAVVALPDLPTGVTPLAVGSAEGCRGHRVVSYGFPAQAPDGGHYGYAVTGDLLAGPLLQLADANDLTTGFSGGPVVDDSTGLVIGMLTEITAPDAHRRGTEIAYATPAETLRRVWPALTESSRCPYRGLDVFTAEHRTWFHGRTPAVRLVLEAFHRSPGALLVLGPSGAGKSSLVRAGVLPAIAEGALPGSDDWTTVVARPGHDLLTELEAAGLSGAVEDGITAAVLRSVARRSGRGRVLVVIDQFEELLTPTSTGAQQRAVTQLTSALSSQAPLSIMVVLRDDFYARFAAAAPGLLESVAPSTVNVPPTVHRDDLRDIIVEPAHAVGLRCQDGLVARIVADVCAIDGRDGALPHAPTTTLPLLELTLQQLGHRRRDGRLTHDAYETIGGVAGSITTWCDATIGQLCAAQRPMARRLLTALVQPADPAHGVPAVRRQVPVEDLRELAVVHSDVPTGGPSVDNVLDVLTAARIVTVRAARPVGQGGSEGCVAELIHDALISDWVTLREWVRQDHVFQDWLRRAQAQHARWVARPDAGELLQGTMLADGVDWSDQRRLPAGVARLLAASRRADRLRRRRARGIISVLVAALVSVTAVGGFAVWQTHTANAARRLATTKRLVAQSIALRTTDSDLSALLAARAYQLDPTVETTSNLYAAAPPLRHRVLPGTAGTVTAASFVHGGRALLTNTVGGADYRAHRWVLGTTAERADWPAWQGKGFIHAVAADGRTMVTWEVSANVTDAALLTVRDTDTGAVRTTLRGNTSYPQHVAFSPDGHDVVTAGIVPPAEEVGPADGGTESWEVVRWDSGTGAVRNRFRIRYRPGEVTGDRPGQSFNPHNTGAESRMLLTGGEQMVLSPDGATVALAVGDGGDVQLRDVTSGRLRRTLSGHTASIVDLEFSPDGGTLAGAGVDRTVRLWDTADGVTRVTLPRYTEFAQDLAFSPDGHTLAIAGGDGTLRLWDTVAHAETLVRAASTESPLCVSFSPDGRTLAMCLDGAVWLWDTDDATSRTTLSHGVAAITAAAFSTDRTVLAVTNGDWSPDAVSLWNLPDGTRHARLLPATDTLGTAASISPDGRTLATGHQDGVVRLWDTATGAPTGTFAGSDSEVSALAFSLDGQDVAVGTGDGAVSLWDRHTMRTRMTLDGPTRPAGRPDPPAVTSIDVSPRGHTLAAGSRDGTVRLWDTTDGHLSKTLTGNGEGVTAVAFSPDGQLLAVGGEDQRVRLWDLRGNTAPVVLVGHTDYVLTLAFAPDGRTLASGSSDQTVRIWDVGTAGTRRVLPSHTHAVLAVAYTPDGRDLVTVTADTVASTWRLDQPSPEGTVAAVCRAAGRDLSAQERRLYQIDGPPTPGCGAD